MKLPSGGGLSQQLSGRIRLDVSGFKADAAKLAREAKSSAEGISNSYRSAEAKAERDRAKYLAEFRKNVTSRYAEEEKRLAGLQKAEQARERERAKYLAELRKNITDRYSEEDQRLANLKKAEDQRVQQRQKELTDLRAKITARYAEEDKQAAENERKRLSSIKSIRSGMEESARAAIKLEKQKQAALAETARLAKKPYEDFRVAVGEARTTLLAFTAAAGGLIYAGLRAADSVDLLTIRYRELARGQAEGVRLMKQVENVARSMNLPIRATQESFLGLIPAVREANGDLEEYANVALRLATLNSDSRGGVEGAIYAIREALSSGGTDLVSLSERFNIPRKALRQAIEDTGDLAKALDLILTRYGATDAAAKANARTLGNLSRLIQDTVSRILERIFAGALETVKNILDGLNAALEKAPQWLTDLGAGAVLAAGAVTGLVVAVDVLTGAWKRGLTAMVAFGTYMKAKLIPAAVSLATTLAPIAALAGAVVGGAFIGRTIVRAAGEATGDERLKNYDFGDAFTTLKQIVFLVVDTIITVVQSIVVAISKVVNSFKSLGSVVDELGYRFTILIADLGIAVQRSLGTFGNADEVRRLEGIKFGAESGLSTLIAERDSLLQDTESSVIETFTNIRQTLLNVLFPVEESANGAADVVRSFDQILGQIQLRYYSFLEGQADAFAAGVDSAISFKQELADLVNDGDMDGLEQRLVGLERERQAINSILPELERQAEFSDAAADKLAEVRARLDEITNSLPDFLDALDTTTGRAVQDSIINFAKEVKEARDKYNAELKKALDSFELEDVKTFKEEMKKRENLRKKEAEATETYRKTILKAEEAFRKRLIDIQRNYIKAVSLAASSLDAAGVVAAIQARVEGRREANEQLTEQRQQALERLQESRLEAAQELQAMRDEFKARREEIVADRLARLNELKAELTESMSLAATAHVNELNEINAYYTRRYADLQNYLVEETNLMYQKRREMLQEFAKQVILPTFQELFGTAGGQKALGMTVGQIIFQINGAMNPAAVAQAVNQQLINLAGVPRGGGAGLG